MIKTPWLQETHSRGVDVDRGALPHYGIELKPCNRCATTYVNEIESADLLVERPQEVRVCNRSQDIETDQFHDPAQRAGEGG